MSFFERGIYTFGQETSPSLHCVMVWNIATYCYFLQLKPVILI